MIGLSVPATVVDVLTGDPRLVLGTVSLAVTVMHLGMLHSVLAERKTQGHRRPNEVRWEDAGARNDRRPRLRMVPTATGIVGMW